MSKKTAKPILSKIAYHSSTQTFSLLTREKEMQLAKKIERHYKKMLWIATKFPNALDVLHTHFHQIKKGKLALNSFICDSIIYKQVLNPSFKTLKSKMLHLSALQSLLKEQIEMFGNRDKRTLATQKNLREYLNTFQWTFPVIESLVQTIHASPSDLDTTKNKRLQSTLQEAFEGFKAVQKELFEGNLRLVFSVAKKYHSEGLDYNDLVCEGTIGLNKAVARFQYRFGYGFLNYAASWIKHQILSFIAKQKCRLPLQDNLEDTHSATLMDSVSAQYLSKMTDNALSSLSDREAKILCMRFGIGRDAEHTVEEIMKQFNISLEDLRRIELKALKALSQYDNTQKPEP